MPAPLGRAVVARLAGCSVAGIVVALAMPPWGFWPLAFVGVAGFAALLDLATSRPRRAAYGFAFALTWMLLAMEWMWFLTAPGYIVTALLFASFHAIAAAVSPPDAGRVVGRAAAHTLAEVVRMTMPFGGVPLATLGISQSGGPFVDLARVGGVILITWWVFQLGFAVPTLIRLAAARGVRRRANAAGPPCARSAIVATIAAVVVLVIAPFAPSGRDRDEGAVTIAAVQGGGEQGTSALDVPSSQVTQAHLDATATIEPDVDLDLVVWPENGIDVDEQPVADSDAFALVAQQAARLGVPISIGVTLDAEFSAHPTSGGFVNAQYVVEPYGESSRGYEKVRIVPFGEYVPLRGLLEALGAPLDEIPSDATRGQDPPVITTADGLDLGVMISWEVFFADRARAAADGEILLNPTNGASYTGTILQTQQVASSRLRAVETGRWVVQVSPTGFSAFVSPSGEVFHRTAVSERRVITMDVPRRTGTTWYTALGDLPWIVAVGSGLLGAAWLDRTRRDRPAAADHDGPTSA